MPMILNQTTVAAGGVNNNVISGSAFEFARVQSIYSIGIGAANQGLFCTLQGGSDIIAEEFPMPVIGSTAANSPSGAAMTTTTAYPVVPDEMYFTDVLNPGDRLVIRVRNPSGTASVVSTVVQISPTGR
jgi:hypothetical protein